MKNRVLAAIEEIKPFLKADGGDVELVDISDNVVTVRLLGACQECNLSKMTLKAGIEETIKKNVPEITKVVAIE